MCLDATFEWTDEDPPPPPPLRIVDKNGNERDQAWLTATFGDVRVKAGTGPGRIVELYVVEGPVALIADVGAADVPVVFSWPDAPDLPAGFHNGDQNRGLIIESKPNGLAEFVMGGGAYYFPPSGGPHSCWLSPESDRVDGLGMLGGTNHIHLNMIWDVD